MKSEETSKKAPDLPKPVRGTASMAYHSNCGQLIKGLKLYKLGSIAQKLSIEIKGERVQSSALRFKRLIPS